MSPDNDSGNEVNSSISEISAAVRVWMGKCPIMLENKDLSPLPPLAVWISLKQKLCTVRKL